MGKPYFTDSQENDLKGRLYSYLRDKANRRADITSKGSYDNMEKQFLRQKQNRDLNSLAVGLNDSANMMGTLRGERVQDPSLQKMSDDLYSSTQGAYENFRTLRQGEEQSNMNDLRVAQSIAGMEHQDWQRGESEKTNELQREKLRRELEAKKLQKKNLVRGVVGSGGAPVVSSEDGIWETRPGYKYDERAAAASQPNYRQIGMADGQVLMLDPRTGKTITSDVDKKFTSQKDGDSGIQKINSSQQARLDNIQMALDATADIEKLFQNPSENALDRFGKAADNFFTLGDTDYDFAINRWNDAVGRMQTGAMINKEEARNFRAMAPKFTDSPEMVRKKLAWMKDEMGRRKQQIVQGGVAKSEGGSQFPVKVRDSSGQVFEIDDQETLNEALQDGAEVVQ